MQTLKELFVKPITRNIDGVIKADDNTALLNEVEEYVITSEIEQRLETLFDAYNNYSGSNGVWISGFFGSGKSHLLKMLALLMADYKFDKLSIKSFFKEKCKSNPILSGAIDKALSIPSESILFNIDQKADLTNKKQPDALISVFVKVFDEHCGYYGKQAYIAKFERDLDDRGQLQQFKDAYKKHAGKPWERGREQAIMERQSIARALADINNGLEDDFKFTLDNYRKDYKVSIEDFANQIQEYINKQAKGFRLNFFVDEVGQYIADNVKLMTNLQTVAESLATKCKGQSWIFVTAQEDMDKVIGDLNKDKGNDFSKIQDRYKNRLKLTSANVAEVIQRRLLTKKEEYQKLLNDLYNEHSNNFQTLFTFGDGTASYKNFQNADHFINSYPFVPYQYTLFQSAIQNLSERNAFEGKHSSVGERSMLGVFRQVLISIKDQPLGKLATFDLMFAGISNAVLSQTQKAIIRAQENLRDEFALRVLKALFLVKYIKEFKASVRNISILMLEGFDEDIGQLHQRVEKALGLLDQQTYIQRNGDLYEFLTDAEQDVENEIKHVDVDNSAILDELERQIFANIIKTNKIRYDAGEGSGFGLDYQFCRKLDEKLYGRASELAIHIISPFHEHCSNTQMVQTLSAYSPEELIIVLPEENRLVEDLYRYKRTEKYISQNLSSSLNDNARRILESKSHQNDERISTIKLHLEDLLSRADIFLAGTKLDISNGHAQTRIYKAFSDLIDRTYVNLRALQGVNYNESDVIKCLSLNQDGLWGSDATNLSAAETEVFAYVKRQQNSGVRTTVKEAINYFGIKPYGWPLYAILSNIAKLFARGKLEVRKDGNILDINNLEKSLLVTSLHDHLILEPQMEFSNSQIKGLKDFFSDYFDKSPISNEPKPLALEVKENLGTKIAELNHIYLQNNNYPFTPELKQIINELQTVQNKPYEWFLTDLRSHEDKLLDDKENIIKPILGFCNGKQSEIYLNAKNFLNNQNTNIRYLNNKKVQEIKSILENKQCYLGDGILNLRQLHQELESEFNIALNECKQKAFIALEEKRKQLIQIEDFNHLTNDQQLVLTEKIDEIKNQIDGQTVIPVIRDTLASFEENEYPNILERIVNLASINRTDSQPAIANDDTENIVRPEFHDSGRLGNTDPAQPAARTIIGLRTLKTTYKKPLLSTAADVEEYVESLKQAMQNEISQGKKIQI